jgi:lysophospholipase L1-like esterase
LADLAISAKVPYLDLFAILSDSPDWFEDLKRSDGVHPSSIGYDLIAQEVSKWADFKGLLEAV